MSLPRVVEIRARLAAIAERRIRHCESVAELDDERELLLAELEALDRAAYRAEAL